MAGPRVVGEENAPARQRLGIGRVRDRRLKRPEQLSGLAEVVDPRSGDLRDQHAAVGQRRIAVRRRDRSRRVVHADAGLTNLTHDPAMSDEEDAAVVRIRDGRGSAREDVCVVRRVQVTGAAALDARMPVQIGHPMGGDVDQEDVVVLLLVRDERPAAGHDEGVVVEDELAPERPVACCREAPERSPLRVDEQDSVVPPVCDQHPAGQRPRVRHDSVRVRPRLRLGLRLRRLRMMRASTAGQRHGSGDHGEAVATKTHDRRLPLCWTTTPAGSASTGLDCT